MTLKREENDELIEQLAEHYREILRLIGEDPEREGLKKTPQRAAKAMIDITRGYNQDAADYIKAALFEYAGSKVVVVKDIEFYSLCEHHILPFFGKVTVGYIPDGKMVGLSKLARSVEAFARRLQVQERLTAEICDSLFENLPNKGVIVLCRAEHMCMKMRGVEKQNDSTVTMEYRGAFEDAALRDEFFKMLQA